MPCESYTLRLACPAPDSATFYLKEAYIGLMFACGRDTGHLDLLVVQAGPSSATNQADAMVAELLADDHYQQTWGLFDQHQEAAAAAFAAAALSVPDEEVSDADSDLDSDDEQDDQDSGHALANAEFLPILHAQLPHKNNQGTQSQRHSESQFLCSRL